MEIETGNYNRDVLIIELELHKAEFSEIRKEILWHLDSERRYVSMSLISLAAVFGFTPAIISNEIYSLLLLLPFIFYLYLFEMRANAKIVYKMSAYLLSKIIPRVNEIIKSLGSSKINIFVLGWQNEWERDPVRKKPLTYWLPLASVAIILAMYFFITEKKNYSAIIAEKILFIFNLVVYFSILIYHIYLQFSKRPPKITFYDI